MPTATGTPASASRCASPASLAVLHRRLARVQHRDRHPVLGQQRRPRPPPRPAPPSPPPAVSKNTNPRRPLERRHSARANSSRSARRPSSRAGVILERAVQVEVDDLIPARPVRLGRRPQVRGQRLPRPGPHQVHRHRQARGPHRVQQRPGHRPVPHIPRPVRPGRHHQHVQRRPGCPAGRTSTPSPVTRRVTGSRTASGTGRSGSRSASQCSRCSPADPLHLDPAPVKPPVPQPPVIRHTPSPPSTCPNSASP